MEMDTLEGKRVYPCEPATVEELTDAVWDTSEGTIISARRLRQITYPIPTDRIIWNSIQCLEIIGDAGSKCNSVLRSAGLSSGVYTNRCGDAIVLIHQDVSLIQQYVEYCGNGLKTLEIYQTKLSSLDLYSLTGLKRLLALDNKVLSHIGGLLQLQQLTYLNICECPQITDLSDLRYLPQLDSLLIQYCNPLLELPTLENFINLTTLCLRGFKDAKMLSPLERLTQLNRLFISHFDTLDELAVLEHLKHLTELEISRCKNLTALPDLTCLSQLTKLEISGCNNLAYLHGLEKLFQLTNLDISGCSSLNQLPDLGGLRQLTNLKLSGCNSLTHLHGLEKLHQLTSLDISRCSGLTQLPDLGGLGQLTNLKLSGCSSLTHFHGLENLFQLTSLDFSGCTNLAELPDLNEFRQLITLKLSGCSKLTELPKLSSLMKLEELDLSRSAITVLPESIGAMISLSRLNLSKLKLEAIPFFLPDIASCFHVNFFDYFANKKKSGFIGHVEVLLFDTTIENVDMSIFEQPYEVVAEWFENRRLGSMQTLNEIKVVFLGDGEAGKSHTIARLMNDGGEPDHAVFDGQSTPGIVIRNKKYTVDGRKFQVHYWDFGGQEIMHSMHRIFLTGRTMYVILLNARDDTQSDRAKYWLHNVKSFAPDAPVLLVLNKIDQNENASVDEPDLRSRYENLTQVIRLSARDFSQEEFNSCFTNKLLKEIQKTGYLDAQWPISWTQVKEKLENMTSHYITGDDYQDICAGCMVDQNQKELLHWFNDLGVSFCCCDKDDYALEDYVILRPDWITNALYIILFNRLEGARNGRIPHQSIYQVLKNAHNNPQIRCTLPAARYTTGDIQYVLGVMRKFNLSFADGNDNEFIPMLCQQNSTVNVHYYLKDAEVLEFNMEFDYLPNNLLHRLMVERHNELDMANVWRTGARFQFQELGYSAVVVIDGNTLRFFIRHTDPMHRPNTYLTMLKANVDRIIEKMGLKAPKNQLIYKLDGKRDEFDFSMLKAMQKAGQTDAFSMTWLRMIPIADILNQSAPDRLDDEMRLLNAIRSSCLSIQADPIYRLIKNVSGTGYENGSDMEDLRNRRVRDDLSKMEFRVADQTQRGASGTGISVGELDMLLLNMRGDPWTIIEALRVSNGTKAEWNKHLTKLVGNYNFFGAPYLYLLTYVDANPKAFARIWEGYQTHIIKYNPGQYTYSEGSFIDLNDANSPRYIKVAKCQYSCSGDPITVYHIFARIPTQNE